MTRVENSITREQFFFQAEDSIRDLTVTGVQTCALPILIATNPDRTCPVEGGEIPDCAGMIAAVEAVTDRKVETIVGKPSPIILEVALSALGVAAADAVMVGDRIETDVAMGKRSGLATILVLSGI